MLRSEDRSVHDAAGDLDPVDRFNAGRAVGEETEAAGRCDRGDGRVALPLVPDLESAAPIGGKDSAFPGEICGDAMGLFLKELHQCRSGLDRGVGAIGDVQRDQEVGKAHDAQPDFPRAFRHAVDGGKGEAVAIDGIVEEAHGEGDGLGQSGEVDGRLCRCARDEVRDIDGAEGAGLIGQERLLATGVGRLDGAQMRGGIGAIDRVQENQSRLTAGPGRFYEPIEQELGRDPSRRCMGAGIDQSKGTTVRERLQEGVGDADGEIEVRHLLRRLFERDEVEDVRMVDPEDAHIGAASGPALLDDVRREVEEAHEGNGPGGHAAR